MRCSFTFKLHLVVLCLSLLAQAGVAAARSQRNLAYRPDLVWTAAVRLLRVDLGFELVERDPEARFVLFRYVDGEHSYPGSLEIAERTLEDGREGVQVIVALPTLPTYVELNLIDRLERKLLEEAGAPQAPERRQRTPTVDENRRQGEEREQDRERSDRDDDGEDSGERDQQRTERREDRARTDEEE